MAQLFSLGVIATRMDKQSVIEILRCLAIAICLCVGILLLYKWTIARANAVLRSWARQNDFEIVHFERCFFTGAFSPLTTSGNQIVYFVRVRDQERHERSGWVRCGSFGHPFGNQTVVKWKDTQ